MNILKLSGFPCPGIGLCHSNIGRGLMMVKELDLKLTLGMAERRKNSPVGVKGANLGQTQSHPLSESGCFLSMWSQYRLGIAPVLNPDKKISFRSS